MKSKREELGQIVIRPPEGMRERIKAAADANNRSMNAEIVATLEEAYPVPENLDVEIANLERVANYFEAQLSFPIVKRDLLKKTEIERMLGIMRAQVQELTMRAAREANQRMLNRNKGHSPDTEE